MYRQERLSSSLTLQALIHRLNDQSAEFEAYLRKTFGGEDGITVNQDMEVSGRNIRNVGRSRRGTDAVNRDEVVSLIETSLRPLEIIEGEGVLVNRTNRGQTIHIDANNLVSPAMSNVPGPLGFSGYDNGEFPITGMGFTTNPTETARWTQSGMTVCLFLPRITGASNATTFTLTGLPSSLQPTLVDPPNTAYFFVRCANNGLDIQALLRLNSMGGILDLFTSPALDAWVAAGTKTLYPTFLTYHLVA